MSAAEPAAGPSGEAIPPRSGGASPGLGAQPQPAYPADEPPTVAAAVNLAPAAPLRPPSAAIAPTTPPPSPRRRRLRWLKVIALVVALPVAAFGIGLLVAWIVHTVRGTTQGAAPRVAPQPSSSAVVSAPPSKPASAPHRVVVPADWVVETAPPAGLTFRHPAGWIRRTALPEILRFAPASAGSTTPGVEGIGAGIEPDAAPAQALQQFVTRTYGTQPQLQRGAITAVADAHSGELQEVLTYARAGVPVRVVVHAFGSGSSSSVIVLARAAGDEPARAAELQAAAEASLQISG